MNLEEHQKRVKEVFETMTFPEAIKEHEKRQKELNKQIYIENDYIILNIDYEYDIELSRCDTEAKLLHWVYHLLGKSWMTQESLSFFIERVAEHHGLNIHGNE